MQVPSLWQHFRSSETDNHIFTNPCNCFTHLTECRRNLSHLPYLGVSKKEILLHHCKTVSFPLPKKWLAVGGLSSFRKAASIAWLKEFWKLGTGIRSELSLSPSLSPGAGGARLVFSSEKKILLSKVWTNACGMAVDGLWCVTPL